MKGLLVASLCFAAICLVSADEEEAAKAAAKECMELHGVSMDELHALKTTGNMNEKVSCFLGCIKNKIGNESKLNEVMEKMGGAISDDKKEKYTKCIKAIKETEDCKVGAAAAVCTQDMMAK